MIILVSIILEKASWEGFPAAILSCDVSKKYSPTTLLIARRNKDVGCYRENI
jgi:hypothetical protein